MEHQEGGADPQKLAALKIQEVMFGKAFDHSEWQRVEQFAAEKAREMRSEKLKRTSQQVVYETELHTDVAGRRIVKPKKRKQ